MELSTVFSTVLRRSAWLVLAASQLWLIYRLEQLTALTTTTTTSTPAVATSAVLHTSATTAVPVAANSDELQALLQRIDLRLAQLERATNRPTSVQTANERYEPSARERAEADQRLSSFLPSGALSREDMVRFHANIQTLPPDERFAMATALARAINEGRVQPGPEGL